MAELQSQPRAPRMNCKFCGKPLAVADAKFCLDCDKFQHAGDRLLSAWDLSSIISVVSVLSVSTAFLIDHSNFLWFQKPAAEIKGERCPIDKVDVLVFNPGNHLLIARESEARQIFSDRTTERRLVPISETHVGPGKWLTITYKVRAKDLETDLGFIDTKEADCRIEIDVKIKKFGKEDVTVEGKCKCPILKPVGM